MNRFEVLEKLLKEETGRYFDGKAIWQDLEEAVTQYPDDGKVWITGKDDNMMKYEYYVEIKRVCDEGQWWTDIKLFEINIEFKKEHKKYHIEFVK